MAKHVDTHEVHLAGWSDAILEVKGEGGTNGATGPRLVKLRVFERGSLGGVDGANLDHKATIMLDKDRAVEIAHALLRAADGKEKARG